MSSTSGWSPLMSSSSRGADDEDSYYLARELDMLERALHDKGQVSRRELGRLVGCRYWGPGRFGHALREGVRQGRLAHPRRGVYGPPG